MAHISAVFFREASVFKGRLLAGGAFLVEDDRFSSSRSDDIVLLDDEGLTRATHVPLNFDLRGDRRRTLLVDFK